MCLIPLQSPPSQGMEAPPWTQGEGGLELKDKEASLAADDEPPATPVPIVDGSLRRKRKTLPMGRKMMMLSDWFFLAAG
ncbi:UNVERIFIED_CONTAM: hypothetical protein Sindi_0713300 [Sesamum indicum]